MTSLEFKLQKLLRFYFLDVLEQMKTEFDRTHFRIKRVLGFFGRVRLNSKLLREAALYMTAKRTVV